MADAKLSNEEQRKLRQWMAESPKFVLRERDLAGVSLAGVKLAGATFVKISFAKSDFTGAQFRDTIFEDCDLSECQFKEAVFEKVSFKRCSLAHVTADKAAFRQSSFDTCSVDGLECNDGAMESVAWRIVNGERLLLRRCSLKDSTWAECKLIRPKFVGCTLNDHTFEQTVFTNFMFMQGQWRGLKVIGGGFDDGAFDRVFLAGASFEKATVKSTQFFGGVQTNVKFVSCPSLENVTLDSTKVCNLMLDGCVVIDSLVILHGDVEEFVIRKGTVAYLDISETSLASTTFSELEIRGLTLLNCKIDAMTLEGVRLSGKVRAAGSHFKALRLVKLQYAPDYEKLADAAEYLESDRFR